MTPERLYPVWVETDAETHSQTSGRTWKSGRRIEDPVGRAGEVKDTTKRPKASINMDPLRLIETEPPAKEHTGVVPRLSPHL